MYLSRLPAAIASKYGKFHKNVNFKCYSTIDTPRELKITDHDGIRTILFNRPEKYNAMIPKMYNGVTKAVVDASNDEATKLIVLTGAGKYFSSGNDFSNFLEIQQQKSKSKPHDWLIPHVAAFIECRKPIVALVNGPALGIAVTILPLCDAVYASDAATFQTPFSALGLSPEGCSTYTFPKIMGYARTNELLLFNRKISAAEAFDWGLVSEVIPHNQFEEVAWNKVKEISSYPIKSIMHAKELVRAGERPELHKTNLAEWERLLERFEHEDAYNARKAFLERRAKSAKPTK